MCPNKCTEKTVLPRCHIPNLVLQYSRLRSMYAEERQEHEVEESLRERYSVFREILTNYPLPVFRNLDMRLFFDAEEDAGDSLSTRSNSSMLNNCPTSDDEHSLDSNSTSVSTCYAHSELSRSVSSTHSPPCDLMVPNVLLYSSNANDTSSSGDMAADAEVQRFMADGEDALN